MTSSYHVPQQNTSLRPPSAENNYAATTPVLNDNGADYGFDQVETLERGDIVYVCPDVETAKALATKDLQAVACDGQWTLRHGEMLGGLDATLVFCDDAQCEAISRVTDGAVSLYRVKGGIPNTLGEYLRTHGDFERLEELAHIAPYYDHREAELNRLHSNVIPLHGDIAEPAPYPIEQLGPIMEPITRTIMSSVQVSAPLAAQAVLSVASVTAQQFVDIKPPYFAANPIPCSLYLLTEADSGERKSSANNVALRPIVRWENHLAEIYDQNYESYKVAEQFYKKLVSKAEGKANKVQDSVKLVAEIGDKPEEPINPSIIFTEPTTEAVLQRPKTSQAGRALITDEAGAFLGGHSMSSEKKQHTLTMYSKLWDGSPITLSRVGRDTPPVRNKRLTVSLMGQSVVINPLLADRLAQGQGFLARFLTVSAPPCAGTRKLQLKNTAQDYEALQSWEDHIYGILSQRTPAMKEGFPNELKPTPLTLSDESIEIWRECAEILEAGQGPNGALSEIKPFASKAAEQALRIAGVLTVIEKPEHTQIIEADIMRRAVALVSFYTFEHLRLVKRAALDPKLSIAQKCIEWIKANRGEFIYKNDIRRYGPNAARNDIDSVLKTLCDYGHLQPIESKYLDGSLRKNCYEVMS